MAPCVSPLVRCCTPHCRLCGPLCNGITYTGGSRSDPPFPAGVMHHPASTPPPPPSRHNPHIPRPQPPAAGHPAPAVGAGQAAVSCGTVYLPRGVLVVMATCHGRLGHLPVGQVASRRDGTAGFTGRSQPVCSRRPRWRGAREGAGSAEVVCSE